MDKILKLIKEQRLRKGISQTVMGRRLSMVSSAYGKIERGQTDLTVKRLTAICEILGLNTFELAQGFLDKKQNCSDIDNFIKPELTPQKDLDLSKKINYMFKIFVNSLVEGKYRLIMEDYPYTEFTAKDWWDSLGDNKEKKLGMSEKEFWETFGSGFQMIFKPEDEYEGFKKLVSSSDLYYFFNLGLIEDEQLCSLFKKYCKTEDTKCYPLESKVSASTVSDYLQSLTGIDIFEPQPKISR